jgi:hypothetical protein
VLLARLHRSDRCTTPVRPVQVWTDIILGFVLVQMLGLSQEVVVARRSPPRAQYGDGRSLSFEMERRDGPWSSFRGFDPPPVREGWFPRSVTLVVFVEVAFVTYQNFE